MSLKQGQGIVRLEQDGVSASIGQRWLRGWAGLAVMVGLVVSGCATSTGGPAGSDTAISADQTLEPVAPSEVLSTEPDAAEASPADPEPSVTASLAPVPPEGLWRATLPLAPPAAATPEPTSPDGAIEFGASDQPSVNIGGETPISLDPVTLVFQSGTVRVLRGCTAAGQGTFIGADDGTWHFDAGSLNPSQCLAATQAGFEAVLDQLAAADSWSYAQSSPADEGEGYSNPEFGVITLTSQNTPLQATFDYTGNGPVDWPSPPDPVPGDPSALNGTWRVESITATVPATPAVTPDGPFAWDITIADGKVTLPRGCNTGTSGTFLADADGWWSFPVSSVRTQMLCNDPGPNQAEQTYDALGAALTWTTDGPNALVFTGTSLQVRLTRAG